MNLTFSNKVALVAGGTGGLGHAVSVAFLAEGAKTVVTYRNHDEFVALQKAAGPNGDSLDGYRVDVTDEAAVGQLVAQILAKHGRIDAIVNTVGGYAGGVKLWELDTAVFDRMLS
ncbi:MAG: SDR family NAD(P)-dependent oxidoreductase, partial [Terracidiphilus sp.]